MICTLIISIVAGMCIFVGLIFWLLVLLLSLFGVKPGEKSNFLLPQSFGFGQIILYAVIAYIVLVLLANIFDSARIKTDARSKTRRVVFTFVVAVAGVVAIYFSWKGGHDVPPPLSIEYRHSYIGKGYVMIIKNISDAPLNGIRVRLGNPDALDNNVADVLNASESKEMGWMQLQHGKLEADEITYVYAEGYPVPVITHAY